MILRLCCAIALSFAAFSAAEADSEPQAAPHPVIGSKTPNVLLASDILALPEAEQQAWIHASVSMMAQAIDDNVAAKCVMNWYFEDNTAHSDVIFAFDRFSDRRATALVYSVAKLSCPVVK